MAYYEPPVPFYEDIYRLSGGFGGEVLSLNGKGEFIFHPWIDIITDSVVYYSGNYSSSDSTYDFEIQYKHTRKRLIKYLPGYRTTTVSYSNSDNSFPIFEKSFYIIRWDHLEYLIPKNKVSIFIDDVNRQIEPEIFLPNYFQNCCYNYSDVPKSLFPKVPVEYESKLNKITTTVLVKEIISDSIITVQIDTDLHIKSEQKLFDNVLVYRVVGENKIMIYDKRRSFFWDYNTNEMTLNDHIDLTDDNLYKYDIYEGKEITVKLP